MSQKQFAIRRLIQQGLTDSSIAEKLCCDRARINRARHLLADPAYIDSERAKARPILEAHFNFGMYVQSTTERDVAEDLGISVQAAVAVLWGETRNALYQVAQAEMRRQLQHQVRDVEAYLAACFQHMGLTRDHLGRMAA